MCISFCVLFLQGTFLTFRSDPFVEIAFVSPIGSFDGGDRVEYDLTLRNVASDSSTMAHAISVIVSFNALDMSRVFINCNQGSSTFNATRQESVLSIASLDKSQTIFCNYTSFIQDHVSPEELITQRVTVQYYNRPLSGSPPNFASYVENREANVTIASINTTIIASENADQLLAGDPVNFTLYLQLPECVTTLAVFVDLPNVSSDVIALSRRRRDLGFHKDG